MPTISAQTPILFYAINLRFCLGTGVPRPRDGVVRPYVRLQLIVFNISDVKAVVARAAAKSSNDCL